MRLKLEIQIEIGPCKSLWQLAEAVERVEIWRLPISSERVTVQLDPLDGLGARVVEILVISVKSQSVADKIAGVLVETKLLVDLAHRRLVRVNVLPRLRVTLIEVLIDFLNSILNPKLFYDFDSSR